MKEEQYCFYLILINMKLKQLKVIKYNLSR